MEEPGVERVSEIRGATALAECRRAGMVSPLPLDKLASRAEAEAFQAAAIRALGGVPCGYKIGATSREAQRLLGCQKPFYSPILCEHVLPSGSTLPVPRGLLGVECEFGFVMGRDVSGAGGIAALRSAIAECFVGLEIVGRRVTDDVPLNEISAIADFGLDVAVIRGRPIPDWESYDLAAVPVRAVRDGDMVAEGGGGSVLGNPLNALAWLVEDLHRRGRSLRSGEIIMTGTCTGITKVAAGHRLDGCFADFSPVQVHLL
jgi:2-keto-4-pentenoate hydratase